ncbi:MAG: hypothetical protein NTV34_12055 [Proteobacteria bacterium]|nr:hypothetical protein [Pseudomonadota bacterium]
MTNRLPVSLALLLIGINSTYAWSAPKPAANVVPPQLLWELSHGLESPESSHYDDVTKTIFVSNVAGEGTAKDGRGWISQVGIDGKMKTAAWASGLNAPKGIRIFKGKLWVTDIDRVVVFDVNDPKITSSIEIPSAKFLNDLAIGPDGTVYVSDMKVSRIHTIKDGKVSLFAEGSQLESPNGLLVIPPYLHVAGWGTDLQADFSTKTLGCLYNISLKTKRQTKVTEAFGNLDGLEAAGPKLQGFLVSDWKAGKIYHTGKSKIPTLILEGLEGAADIGFIAKSKILLVPEMKANRLRAYQL